MSRNRTYVLSRLVLAALLVTAQGTMTAAPAQTAPATVFVVRHAEKAGPTGDVPLNPAGEARSRLLADMLASAGVKAIYSTPYRRTRDTARPLAERLGVTVDSMPGDPRDPPRSGEALLRLVRERHAGQAVLVVGHSNTVPAIVAAFTGQPAPPMADEDYNDLYVITVWPDRASVTRLKFGT